mgnify:CR=1 FL=1
MEWIDTLFVEHTALQAVVVVALICAAGMALGKVRIGGISLGVTFVFFVGILAGHFGLSVDEEMLEYAESFGLVDCRWDRAFSVRSTGAACDSTCWDSAS